MKSPADIPQDRLFPTLIPFANDLPTLQQLVEHSPCGCTYVLFRSVPILSHSRLRVGSIKLFSRYVKIARQDHSLAHGHQIPYACIDDVEKAEPKVVSRFVAVGRAVHPKQHKSWEFKDNASAFGIEHRGVDCRDFQLNFSWISTDALVFWTVTKACCRARGTEYASNAFFGANWSADGLPCVYHYSRVTFNGDLARLFIYRT